MVRAGYKELQVLPEVTGYYKSIILVARADRGLQELLEVTGSYKGLTAVTEG